MRGPEDDEKFEIVYSVGVPFEIKYRVTWGRPRLEMTTLTDVAGVRGRLTVIGYSYYQIDAIMEIVEKYGCCLCEEPRQPELFIEKVPVHTLPMGTAAKARDAANRKRERGGKQ